MKSKRLKPRRPGSGFTLAEIAEAGELTLPDAQTMVNSLVVCGDAHPGPPVLASDGHSYLNTWISVNQPPACPPKTGEFGAAGPGLRG